MSGKQTSLESFLSGGGKKRKMDNDNEETAAGEKNGEKESCL